MPTNASTERGGYNHAASQMQLERFHLDTASSQLFDKESKRTHNKALKARFSSNESRFQHWPFWSDELLGRCPSLAMILRGWR